MDNTTVSPFVIADAYRVGQQDGFKTGIAVGVVGIWLVKAALRNHNQRTRRVVSSNPKR